MSLKITKHRVSKADDGYAPAIAQTPRPVVHPGEVEGKASVKTPDGSAKTAEKPKPKIEKADIKQPGKRGGKWYRDDHGNVRYGEKPTGRPSKKDDIAQSMSLHEKLKRRAPGKGGHVNLTKAELLHVLADERFALVSAGPNPTVPEDKDLTPEQVASRHKKLGEDLKQLGFMYTHVEGHYGGKEDSYLVMVHDADRDEVTKLGNQYHQDSVIYAEAGHYEMIYTHGPHVGQRHEGSSWKEVPDASDFYTVVSHPDGSSTKFTLDFDFDKFVKAMIQARLLPDSVRAKHMPYHNDYGHDGEEREPSRPSRTLAQGTPQPPKPSQSAGTVVGKRTPSPAAPKPQVTKATNVSAAGLQRHFVPSHDGKPTAKWFMQGDSDKKHAYMATQQPDGDSWDLHHYDFTQDKIWKVGTYPRMQDMHAAADEHYTTLKTAPKPEKGDSKKKPKVTKSHGGEGSRGGHVVGHTKSGKAVYGTWRGPHKTHGYPFSLRREEHGQYEVTHQPESHPGGGKHVVKYHAAVREDVSKIQPPEHLGKFDRIEDAHAAVDKHHQSRAKKVSKGEAAHNQENNMSVKDIFKSELAKGGLGTHFVADDNDQPSSGGGGQVEPSRPGSGVPETTEIAPLLKGLKGEDAGDGEEFLVTKSQMATMGFDVSDVDGADNDYFKITKSEVVRCGAEKYVAFLRDEKVKLSKGLSKPNVQKAVPLDTPARTQTDGPSVLPQQGGASFDPNGHALVQWVDSGEDKRIAEFIQNSGGYGPGHDESIRTRGRGDY